METIDAGDLRVAYRAFGAAGAPPVLMLHGWPDDLSTWDGVVAKLEGQYRLIVPSLRGFGETRFRSDATHRCGNSAMLAMDAIALMDALSIDRFAVVGHDWGSNMAEGLVVGWPHRIERIAMLSTPSRLGGLETPPFWHARLQWYHWFQATKRGEEAVRADPKGFARIMWETWTPQGWFDEATFDTVSKSFENADWLDITLHSYRSRWGEAAPDPRSVWLEDKVKATETLSLPAIYIQGAEDGVNPPPASKAMHDKFTGFFEYYELPDVGHFPQREAPAKVAKILDDFLSGSTLRTVD